MNKNLYKIAKMSVLPNAGNNESSVTAPKMFGDPDLDRMAMEYVGNMQRYRENIIIPKSNGPVKIKTNEEKFIETAVESCGFKCTMACVMGG